MAKNRPLSYRVAIILLAFFQNALLGGLLFGWTSISGSLLISDKEDGGPGLTADFVHTMFVVASFFSCLGPLVMGVALDNCGPRVCSILSISLIGIGCLGFGVSNDSYPLFIPAMCLIAIGGPGVLNATIHLSNLFPTLRSTTTAIITGSFQFSFLVFFVFDELWVEWHLNYTVLFGSYFVVCVVNCIISTIIWPDQPYTVEEVEMELIRTGHPIEYHKELLRAIQLPSEFIHHPKVIAKAASMPCLSFLDEVNRSTTSNATEDRRRSLSYDMATSDSSFMSSPGITIEMGIFHVGYHSPLETSTPPSGTLTPPTLDVKELSFIEQLRSEEFMSFTSFFVVISFWVNFYIGSFGLQLGDSRILSGAAEEQAFARLFTVVMTCGVVVIPVVGTMMDWVGFTITSVVIISLGLLWSLLILIPSKTALIASFVAYTCFRTFFFTFLFAYIADTLGFKFFGALSGVMFVIGGVFGLLQYPLSQYAMGTCHLNLKDDANTCTKGSWREVNLLMLVMIVLSFMFSYRDWVRRRKIIAIAAAKEEAASLNGSARKAVKRMCIDNSKPFESIPFAKNFKKGKDISPPRYKSVLNREDTDTSYTFEA